MACRDSENAPEITAWLAITVAAVASTTIGSRAQPGSSRKNGFSSRAGSSQDQRRLPEVVQRQRREDDEEPGAQDRRAAEVAHVGVERLGAGDDQHDRAHRHEA